MFTRLLAVLFVVFYLLSACKSHDLQSKNESLLNSFLDNVFGTKEITFPDYIDWLKDQKGLTYAEREDADYKLAVLYKPLQFEAALAPAVLSATAENQKLLYKSALDSKKGYHYILIECLNKHLSATGADNAYKETFRGLKNHIIVVKNDKDTIRNYPVEVFMSSLMNQPDQIFLMIPSDSVSQNLQTIVSGKQFGFQDLKLTIPAKQFDSFPELKF